MPFGSVIAGIAGLTTAGIGIAGAAGAFAPDAPDQPNYAGMTRDALQAQIDLLPEKFRARQQYDPKFASLQRQTQYENLFGTTAGSREEEYIAYELTPVEKFVPNALGKPTATTVMEERPVVRTRTVSTDGAPGMLELARKATPELNQIGIDSQNQQTAANLGRLQKYGPDAFKAIQNFDPAAAALSDQLLGNAQEELAAGRGMTASQRRESEQGVRAAQSVRGFGMGPVDAFQEAMYLGDRGEQQLNRRQAYASSILGQRNGLYGRAYEALGLSPGQGADASPYLGAAGQQGPDYTAINPAAYSVGMAGYNAQQNANMAGYNSQMGSLGFLGNLGGQAYRAYANQPSRGGAPAGTTTTGYASYAPGSFFGGY